MASSFPALAVQPQQQPDMLGNYARLLQIRNAQQQGQAGGIEIQQKQLELQAQQRAADDSQKLTAAYAQSGGDLDKFLKSLPASGASADGITKATQGVMAMRKQTLEMDEATAKQHEAVNNAAGPLLQKVLDAKPEDRPAVYAQVHQIALNDPLLAQVAMKQPPQYPGDDAFGLIVAQTKTTDQLLKERQTVAEEKTAAARETTANRPQNVPQSEKPLTDMQIGQLNQGLQIRWNVLHPGQALPVQFQIKAGATQKDFDNLDKLMEATEHATSAKSQLDLNNTQLNKAAMDQAAEKYFQTGELPAMGMGAAGAATRRQIMNRAGELHPEGVLAANSATFKANQDSLKSLQKNFDQVTAFENTAGKNLDQFLSTAQKVVDSGSPWINAPLRTVNKGALGSSDQAAFEAARVTALTEISKVLNSSNASGVLSDSARSEVSQLIGPNATLKQIVSAANILKTDMGNRHQAYQDQIADIQKRLGTQSSSSTTPAAQGSANQPPGATHTGIGSVDKKKHWLDANGKDLGLVE